MKKYILSVFVVVGLLISLNNVHAEAVPANQIKAIVEILKTLKIDNSKITQIRKILEANDVSEKTYSPSTGKEIIPTPKVESTGCENNYKYNTKTGKKCSGYKEPAVIKCNGVCPTSA